MKRTYQETLAYLFQLLPMYQHVGKRAFKKDLTNIKRISTALGNPHQSYPCIHIAGTNGKGTVTHLLAAMLQSYGLRVGVYTSPHYVDFRERMKINGQWISKAEVIEWVSRYDGLLQDTKPSFFEATVAMAFDFFRHQEVDIAVIETGMGGRLDSTNIILPILSVITHISLDHQDTLGPTIYHIAREKAGIIKAHTPVVIGRYQASCDHVFISKAKELQCPISWASQTWSSTVYPNKCEFLGSHHEITLAWSEGESPFLRENMVTALAAFEVYCSLTTTPWQRATIEDGLTHFRSLTRYIGRWQILSNDPFVIADSAHNEDAIAKVVSELEKLKVDRIHFVLGFVKDKDIETMLGLFPREAKYYFVRAMIDRALPAEQLCALGARLGLKGSAYETVALGIAAAKSNIRKNELIYIGGSSFVVGDALTV